MKRHGEMFDRIIEYDNLESAYRKAAKGRRFQPDIVRFHANIEENLIILHNELQWNKYIPGEYRTFEIFEPKQRTIYAAPFRDRVVHHAIMNVLEPIWEGLFIHDSYACRKQKGTHVGVARLQAMLESCRKRYGKAYVLKGDIRKFFPSINHHILMRIIERKIKCKRTLALLRMIIFHTGDEDDQNSHDMPIGNLISQWGANLYLNELDMFSKHHLKATYYIRYMDDFIILHPDKIRLHDMLRKIGVFLEDRLSLNLNKKTSIFPASQGIDFLGYRIWEGYRLLRKASARRMIRRMRWMQKAYKFGIITHTTIGMRIRSWVAHCGHCNSWRIRKRIMSGAVFVKDSVTRS